MYSASRCFLVDLIRCIVILPRAARVELVCMVRRDTFSTVVAREKHLASPQIALPRCALRGVLDESPVLAYLCARHVCRAAAAPAWLDRSCGRGRGKARLASW